MMSELALLPSARSLHRWDATATVYVVVVVGAGLFAGQQIWSLAELHRGLLDAADALDLTARAIGLVGQVPLIGSGADQLAGSVADTSAQIRTSAVAARADVRSLALVIGAAIALLPIVPVLVLYVPLRWPGSGSCAGCAACSPINPTRSSSSTSHARRCTACPTPNCAASPAHRGGTSTRAATSCSPQPSCAAWACDRPRAGAGTRRWRRAAESEAAVPPTEVVSRRPLHQQVGPCGGGRRCGASGSW